MRWFVLASDGKTYGPVPIDVLRQWCLDGRIVPETSLHEEGTGILLRAGDIPDLHPYLASTPPAHARIPMIQCTHCGSALPPGSPYCAQCGARMLAFRDRRLTGIKFVDGLLGALTVVVVALITFQLFRSGITASGYFIFMPAVVPIALYVALSRTYRAYSTGLLAGCLFSGCIFPLAVTVLAAMGISSLGSSFGTELGKIFRCGY